MKKKISVTTYLLIMIIAVLSVALVLMLTARREDNNKKKSDISTLNIEKTKEKNLVDLSKEENVTEKKKFVAEIQNNNNNNDKNLNGKPIYNNEKKNSKATEKEEVKTTLKENNCDYTIDEEKSTVKIEQYDGSADVAVIDKNIGEYEVSEIKEDAFDTSYNVDTILISKEIAKDNLVINNFEVDNSTKNNDYVKYTAKKEYSEAYKKYLALSAEEKNETEIIPRKYDIPLSAIDSKKVDKNYNLEDDETVPEKFDLRDKIYIETENQNETGTCYAYATMRAVTTNVQLTQHENIDLSEVHMGAFKSGYGGWFLNSDDDYYANGIGPVYEVDCPMDSIYEDNETSKLMYKYLTGDSDNISQKEIKKMREDLSKIKSVKKVTETVNFPSFSEGYAYSPIEKDKIRERAEKTKLAVKKHIMNYGSLYASISGEDIFMNASGSYSVNSKGYSFPNHAISIIGWDDNYSKDNFIDKPKNDGAYIALNSWGDNWGDKGVFWISYEDYWVGTDMSGVVKVEDVSKDIRIDTYRIKNIDEETYYKENEIPELGDKIQIEIKANVENISETDELKLQIKTEKNIDITDKVAIKTKGLENGKANIVIELDTNKLDKYLYIIYIKSDEDNFDTVELQLGKKKNYFEFQVNEDGKTITITEYKGTEKEITIPKDYLGYEVTKIADEAFRWKMDLACIVVDNNIQEFGNDIIDNRTLIKGINGSKIESYAKKNGYKFVDINEKTITGKNWEFDIENNKLYVTDEIDENDIWNSFSNDIYEVEIKDGIKKIDEYEFYGHSNLKKVTIPESVKSIGASAFGMCENLQEVVLPSQIKEIKEETFYGCSKLSNIEIPENVKKIDRAVFSNCYRLKIAKLPGQLTELGEDSFCMCWNLKKIEIPSSIKTIGKYCFFYDLALEEIEINAKLNAIPDYTFGDCRNLEKINIPDGYTYIGKSAFESCKSIELINIPQSIKEIDDSAFKGCSSLKNIDFPTKLERIGNGAFEECKCLTEIELPVTIKKIGENVFLNSTITYYIEKNKGENKIVEAPNLIKRIMDKNDILYVKKIELYNTDEIIDGTKVELDKSNNEILAEIESDFLGCFRILIKCKSTNKLESISITKAPNKTKYVVGEYFDFEGMKAVAKYQDGKKMDISEEIYETYDGDDLKEGQESVTVAYYEDDIIVKAKQKIKVYKNEEDLKNDSNNQKDETQEDEETKEETKEETENGNTTQEEKVIPQNNETDYNTTIIEDNKRIYNDNTTREDDNTLEIATYEETTETEEKDENEINKEFGDEESNIIMEQHEETGINNNSKSSLDNRITENNKEYDVKEQENKNKYALKVISIASVVTAGILFAIVVCSTIINKKKKSN